MSALQALKLAETAGVRIKTKGADLALEAPTAPPIEVLDLLSRHKAEVVTLLRAGHSWSHEDWNVYFNECAGILEYDHHLSRPEAEYRAYGMTLVKWMDAHRLPSERLDVCEHCHGDGESAAIVPCLSALGGHYSVHNKCLPEALEAMGMTYSSTASSIS